MHVYLRHMYIAVYLRYHESLLVNINIFYMTPQKATWKNSYYLLNVLPSLNKVLLLLKVWPSPWICIIFFLTQIQVNAFILPQETMTNLLCNGFWAYSYWFHRIFLICNFHHHRSLCTDLHDLSAVVCGWFSESYLHIFNVCTFVVVVWSRPGGFSYRLFLKFGSETLSYRTIW